jgi:hypothetical protein
LRRHGGLVAGFVVVHLWLFWAIKHAPNHPLYDVPHVYLRWVERGLVGGHWVGIGSPWVYPIGALVPMVLVAALGLHHYGVEWLAVVTVLNGLACLCLSRSGARGRATAYWWLVFLAALGPIALGRIDAMTVPLAMVAVLIVDRRPGLAAALLTFAACVKVWPIALLVTILIGSRSRLRILVASGIVASLVFGISLILGASLRTLSSFLTKQSGRGLQLESPAAVPWLWLKAFGSTHVHVVWRPEIKTINVVGHGTDLLAQALTPLMVLIFGVACALGIRAARANPRMAALLGPLALALTSTLIVTNKVGSPQYETWIAAPIVLGLLQEPRGGPSFRVAAVLGVLVAGLTQLIYPWGYPGLEAAHLSSVILITLRNALLIVLLGISIKQLMHAAMPEPALSSKASRRRDANDESRRV